MKGMTTCKVCGRDFAFIKEEHYIAQDPDREGGQIGVIMAGKEQPIQYDAFDCPHCGCQHIIQERKRIFIPDNLDVNQLFDNDEDDLK